MPRLRPRPEDKYKHAVLCNIEFELNLQNIDRHKLGKLLSLSQSTLLRRLKDPGNFTLTELMMIARVTRTTVAELVTERSVAK